MTDAKKVKELLAKREAAKEEKNETTCIQKLYKNKTVVDNSKTKSYVVDFSK